MYISPQTTDLKQGLDTLLFIAYSDSP